MALKVLLTVDLNHVTSNQRKVFYDEMDKRQYTKTKLTTTWIATFVDGVVYGNAVATCKADMQASAAKANILNYEFAFMVSENAAEMGKK